MSAQAKLYQSSNFLNVALVSLILLLATSILLSGVISLKETSSRAQWEQSEKSAEDSNSSTETGQDERDLIDDYQFILNLSKSCSSVQHLMQRALGLPSEAALEIPAPPPRPLLA